jgi:hypothetical protein
MSTTQSARGGPGRSGIAMLLSLVAVIIVGGVAAAISAATMIEQRTGETTRRQNQAFAVADAAAGEIIGNWNAGTYNQMAVGTATAVSGTSPLGTGSFAGSVSRINNEIFLVDIVGRDRASQARQRLGMLVKLRVLTFDANSALTTRGPGRVSGSGVIDGTDAQPWPECPGAGPMAPGIRHPNVSQLDFQGTCAGLACVVGNPQALTDPTVNDNTFFNYGESDWAALSSAANIVLPSQTLTGLEPSVSGGQCNRLDANNWGEPHRSPTHPSSTVSQCTSYFPTIYVNGDARITTGRGQGVLMVNGDLELQGNFRFIGIMIVRGRLRTTGTGAHITGGVLAANVDLDDTFVAGNATIQFSRCAITAVQSSGAPGALFRSRGWTQIF